MLGNQFLLQPIDHLSQQLQLRDWTLCLSFGPDMVPDLPLLCDSSQLLCHFRRLRTLHDLHPRKRLVSSDQLLLLNPFILSNQPQLSDTHLQLPIQPHLVSIVLLLCSGTKLLRDK